MAKGAGDVNKPKRPGLNKKLMIRVKCCYLRIVLLSGVSEILLTLGLEHSLT